MLAEGSDMQAIFQEATSYGALIHVSLDRNDPDLPPARGLPDSNPDFWPDPIYPDE
jgi:hypothetical protein